MTRELSRKMLLEYVIPAIKAKWPHAQMLQPIKIQQYNARPHVDVNDPVVVAAGTSGGWNIRLANQPAQSPELNALDVGFFYSIQSLQSQTIPRNVEQLIDEVSLAFEATAADTLEKTFVTLQLMMKHIMISTSPTSRRIAY
ncbi:hypothetical protein L917_17270 [Phytophthora nicotianae]|uniref:Uncharacterized protein n=1 Tax=Phytophthora nicotianae TaxID=4792 RepID=W2KBJ6_PHYNI|nr:hypothetical protein L917_17270 [Phytophthora nicotianae]